MNEKKTDQITQLPVCDLHPFSNHPFHPYPEELMADLCRSIEENGIITPIIVRAVSKGTGYEIIAGHNRVEACRRIGMETIPAIVREVDTDTAILMMVDSNQQREHLLPSEKAFAYKMKLEAMKRQVKKNGARTQVGYRPGERSADLLGKEIGESRNQIQIFGCAFFPQLCNTHADKCLKILFFQFSVCDAHFFPSLSLFIMTRYSVVPSSYFFVSVR